MVTHSFPPRGGSGVQRNVKFLKYLNRLNWKTTALTVKKFDYYVFDETLLEEVKDTEIIRSESLDPLRISQIIKNHISRFSTPKKAPKNSSVVETSLIVKLYRIIRNLILFPDGVIGWYPFAIRKGIKEIKKNGTDIIFSSFPGPTNALVGYKLSKSCKKPLVLDFRDGWLDDPYTKYPTFLHVWGHKRLEKKILAYATLIIVYGQILKDRFLQRYPNLESKIKIIPNGFDPEDIIQSVGSKKNDKEIKLVYSGNLFGERKNNLNYFLEAIKVLDPIVKEKISLTIIGQKSPEVSKLVRDHNLIEQVCITGYLTHNEALKHLSTADAGIVFLPPGEFTGITGKVFEYLGYGLSVIACVEKEGACSKLLETIDWHHGVCKPDNIHSIKSVIQQLDRRKWPKLEKEKVEIFSRKYHTELLSNYMKDIIE